MLILAIIINFLVLAWVYPEMFYHLDFRMVEGHETCVPMQGVFSLISQFFQGDVQLFDRYDLFSGAFTHLSAGLYTTNNFIIALGYILLSPFVKNPAQFFHHWYVFAYYGLGLIIRTFGTYVLALYMTKSRFTAVLTTVLVNCFCGIPMIHVGGVNVAPIYSYLPLLLFCLVYYWDTRSFKAIIASVMVFVIAVIYAPLVGFGYFYQTLHLFLFDMLMVWLIFQRRHIPLLADKINWRSVIKLGIVIVLIFLPILWWGKILCSDFQVAGSGLGGTQGRFHRIYNPIAMMKDPTRFFISSQEIFSRAYDFTISGWYSSGIFLGITIMVLCVLGLVLGRHSYKYVFISAAVMMAFLNVPSAQLGWITWAHWIDTITNPFCFLVRSFHMSVILWYLSLAIPICLGVKACYAMVVKDFKSIYAKRLNLLKGVLIGILLSCLYIPNPVIKKYVMVILGLFLFFLVIFDGDWLKGFWRMGLAGVLFLVIMGIELGALKSYVNTQCMDMNGAYWDGLRVKPRVFSYMYTSPTPMILDYQNPKILPVRFFYRTDTHVVFPLILEFQGMFGHFYSYMPLAERLVRPDSLYVPRMKIFKDIDQDQQIQEYIRRDGRVMYMADAAIAPNQKDYDYILASGLDRRVVQVEDAHLDKVQNLRGLNLPAALPENFKRHDYLFQASSGTVQDKPEGTQYQWALPKDFPRYLSTAVFTMDVQLWQLSVGANKLVPAQGALVAPGTFDVNNVRDGYVTVLYPKDMPIGQQEVELHVWTPAELVDVWRNTQDEFGFTYHITRGGWWVMHMPFDSKWQLSIDGVKTPLSKINRYFIGAPLSAGEHQILLSYWPGSLLRPLIILSVLLTLIMMFMVFRWTYRWSHE